MSNLRMVIAGTSLPLLETEVLKNNVGTGKFWHCFRLPNHKPTMFGLGWAPLSATLPTSVEIDGEHIALTKGLTAATSTNFTTKVVTAKVQRNKVSASGTFHPVTIGEQRAYSVSISETTDGQWNIKVSINRGQGSVSPEQRRDTARARNQANQAALAAFMNF